MSTSASQQQSSRPKLKDACQRCAASKVKCDHARPTCARCAKRNLPCEYRRSRRMGRVPAGSMEEQDPKSMSGSDLVQRQQFSTSGADSLDALNQNMDWSIDNYDTNDWFSDDLFTAGGANNTDWEAILKSLNAETLMPPASGAPVAPMMGSSSIPPPPPSSQSGSESARSRKVSTLSSNSSSAGTASSGDESYLFSDWSVGTDMTDPTDFKFDDMPLLTAPSPPLTCSENGDNSDCLSTALRFIIHLSPSGSNACALSSASAPDGKSVYAAPTPEGVLEENKNILESLQTILGCSCTQENESLLALIALAILKLLTWYSRVAKGDMAPGQDAMQSNCEAAQAVLSELHAVRRLIHSWNLRCSTFIENSVPDGSRHNSTGSLVSSAAGLTGQMGMLSGGSASLLGHSLSKLQLDLDTGLRNVSGEAIEILRGW